MRVCAGFAAATPRWTRRLLLGAAALALVACSSGPEKPRPRPLEPLTPQNVARLAWSQRVGPVQVPLAVAAASGSVTAASSDGTVVAIDVASGRDIWRTQIGTEIRAGVGTDGRYAAVVTREGELVAIEQGQVRWRKPVATRVVTAPLVAGERVFVLGVDRSVQAFDALDGRKLWTLQRPGDPLTLSQPGVLAPYKNTLLVGQGPRLAGVDSLAGTVQWEAAIGSPRGANEVERLADLVGPLARSGDLFCARAFQLAVGCVDGSRGSVAWSRAGPGTDAVATDREFVYGADASDRMTAWRLDGGAVVWSSEALLYRGLSAPAVLGRSVVYGDAEGTLHWLARDTGAAQLRLPTDGSAVIGAPVVVDGTLIALTRNGGLFAFRAP